MLRRLKSGEFDERAFSIEATLIENYEIPSPEPEKVAAPKPVPAAEPKRPAEPAPVPPAAAPKSDLSLLFELPVQKTAASAASASAEKPEKNVVSLDEAILNFFGANDK
jgi:hypothetical protein